MGVDGQEARAGPVDGSEAAGEGEDGGEAGSKGIVMAPPLKMKHVDAICTPLAELKVCSAYKRRPTEVIVALSPAKPVLELRLDPIMGFCLSCTEEFAGKFGDVKGSKVN